MKFFSIEEFYPTPATLLDKIFQNVNWKKVQYVLEPSAGKGHIVKYILDKAGNYPHYNKGLNVDCIEKDPDLQKVLEGEDLRVVHDDFLTYRTFKRYDLIVMNPPFSNGAAHLLKALDLMKEGGIIICILNAETIRNPYTNERKLLKNKLDELRAQIEFLEDEFAVSERPTKVEVAVVRVVIEEKSSSSYIYEDLKCKKFQEYVQEEPTAVAVSDYIKAAVQQYEIEVEAGINLIYEYKALSPYILDSLDSKNPYRRPILSLKVGDKELSVNAYVKLVRMKYWETLFKDKRFTGGMTSNQYNEYASKVQKMGDYDFSYYNIKTMQEKMSKNLVRGIEECIISLFDELSHQYSYSGYGTDKNIHYFNGWKTNKAWIINKKVILPFMNAWSSWNKDWYRPTDYKITEKLSDIEKALNYLDGGLSYDINLFTQISQAEKSGQTKKIHLKYFDVTFYKKGTMHIEFTNEELLKKLNIFGSQQKRWLPPAYGKKTYAQMDAEERAIVDSFEGAEEYSKMLANADYYLYDPKDSLPMLETNIV